MNEWNEGYVTEIEYTQAYYAELNPLRARLPLLYSGFRPPDVARACELGFGMGLSLAIHAAANDIEWWGTDFNPSHAVNARDMLDASGAVGHVFDESFAEFCAREDLPEFDFIGLHGIWSWVSEANRRCIVDLLARRLRPGGLVYISYNAMPGWAPMLPVRNFLAQYHAACGRQAGSLLDNIGTTLDFARRLADMKTGYMGANPSLAERIRKLCEQNRSYLAHEYFNADWTPMAFGDVALRLSRAKLGFACSAVPLDLVPFLNFTSEQAALIEGTPDPVLRETIRDLLSNQQFRREYWIKGAKRLQRSEQQAALRLERVAMSSMPGDLPERIRTPVGEVSLHKEIYEPIVEAIWRLGGPLIGDVERECSPRGIGIAQIAQALVVLMGRGLVTPACEEAAVRAARPSSDALNSYLLASGRVGQVVDFLASPVSGGGVPANVVQQLFIAARQAGLSSPADLSDFAWRTLSVKGHKLLKDGKALEGEHANRNELAEQASAFLQSRAIVAQRMLVFS